MSTVSVRDQLPPAVAALVGDRPLDAVADDGTQVWQRVQGDDLVVVTRRPPDSTPLLAELDRLYWLDGRASAPHLVASGRGVGGAEVAVLRISDGLAPVAGGAHGVEPSLLASQLAMTLRAAHGIDGSDCPFDASTAALRAEAGRRVGSGAIAVAADGPYRDVAPLRMLEIVDSTLDELGDGGRAFIHGSLTLADVWVGPTGDPVITGWGGGGMGDPYVDVAAVAEELADLHGPALVPVFLELYTADIDLRRLDAHQLLRQLRR